MERVNERLNVARRALGTLEELLGPEGPVSPVVRDAAIQRFEYTFEAVWKAARLYLRMIEGLDVNSPKGVVRASLRVGLLDENQARLGLEMTDDRNRTVHTYNENIAKSIYSRLPGYARLMGHWLGIMDKMLQS